MGWHLNQFIFQSRFSAQKCIISWGIVMHITQPPSFLWDMKTIKMMFSWDLSAALAFALTMLLLEARLMKGLRTTHCRYCGGGRPGSGCHARAYHSCCTNAWSPAHARGRASWLSLREESCGCLRDSCHLSYVGHGSKDDRDTCSRD